MARQFPDLFARALTERFREGFLSTARDDLETYGSDWTRVHEPCASAVAFPSTTAEVSALLALCNEHDVKVVPSHLRRMRATSPSLRSEKA